jgi:hypothetical protein
MRLSSNLQTEHKCVVLKQDLSGGSNGEVPATDSGKGFNSRGFKVTGIGTLEIRFSE